MSRQILARAVLMIVCALPLHPGTGFLWAQTPGAAALPKYSELIVRSAELTPEQKNQALTFFKLGFDLWQSGDFSAAQIAFKQGLDIDPVNPQANYYYGDSLLKTKDRKGAAEFFARSAALGPATLEGIKSQAALQALTKPVPLPEMSIEEIKEIYIGTWLGNGNDSAVLVISKNEKGDLVASGGVSCFLCASATYENLTFDGANIRFNLSSVSASYVSHLVSQDRMEGVASGPYFNGPIWAIRKK